MVRCVGHWSVYLQPWLVAISAEAWQLFTGIMRLFRDVPTERRSLLMTNDTDGVSQTSLPDGTSEEAWQVVSSSLQAARDEPSEDLSLLAQNPLCGRDCIYRSLCDEGRNLAKQFSVVSDHRALEEQWRVRIRQLLCQQTSKLRGPTVAALKALKWYRESSPAFHGDYHRPLNSKARASLPDKAPAWVAEAWYFPALTGHGNTAVAAPRVLYPLIVLAACRVIDEALV